MNASVPVAVVTALCVSWILLDVASAQTAPILTLEPSSGSCDATVTASGEGFLPDVNVELALGRLSSDTKEETLVVVTADDSGAFTVDFSFGQIGCGFANSPLNPERRLGIFVQQPPGQHVLNAFYQVAESTLPTAGTGPGAGRPLVPVLLVVLIVSGTVLITIGKGVVGLVPNVKKR